MAGFFVKIAGDPELCWRPTLSTADAYLRQRLRTSADGTAGEIQNGSYVVLRRFVARGGVARVQHESKSEPWYAPRVCPACGQNVNRNRDGNLAQHVREDRFPRKRRGRDDPKFKIVRSQCLGSGKYAG